MIIVTDHQKRFSIKSRHSKYRFLFQSPRTRSYSSSSGIYRDGSWSRYFGCWNAICCLRRIHYRLVFRVVLPISSLKIKQDLLEPLIRHVFSLPISWCCGTTSDYEDWSCHWWGLFRPQNSWTNKNIPNCMHR